MPETFLHSMFIDFNAFFASVEQQLRPELRDRPVVVVPVLTDATCCIAASREARPFGIKTGTPVHEARRLCPDLTVVEARPERYIRCHRFLNDVIEDCGVSPHDRSIDEVHCKLWGEWMEVGAARQLAVRIKAAIAAKAGTRLTCSIGLAPNEFLAKTASDMEKPDGLVVIEPHDLPHKLHRLELRDLYGVGARMEARLHAHAITSVEQLCAASKQMLHAVWGSVEGDRFHANLHGKPAADRVTERRTLGHSHVLPPELRSERGARSVLHRLTQKAAMRLRSHGCVTGGMSLFIACAGRGAEWSDDIRFAPTPDTFDLLRALDLLWERRSRRHAAVPLRVGICLFDLQDEMNAAPPLFERSMCDRRRALLETVDRINIKKGRNTVYFAGAHGAVEYTPLRIAFTRIPDLDTER